MCEKNRENRDFKIKQTAHAYAFSTGGQKLKIPFSKRLIKEGKDRDKTQDKTSRTYRKV